MLAVKQDNLTRSFLGFASEASNLLHIKTEQGYHDALETIEYLFAEAKDEIDDPLNDLIDIISRAIEKYELDQEAIVRFHKEADEQLDRRIKASQQQVARNEAVDASADFFQRKRDMIHYRYSGKA